MNLDQRSVEAKLDDAVLDRSISPHVAKEMYEAIARSMAVFVKMEKEQPQMKDALKKGIDAFDETLKPNGNSATGARAAKLPKLDPYDELILLGGELVWKLGFLQATPREGPCSEVSALSDGDLQASSFKR